MSLVERLVVWLDEPLSRPLAMTRGYAVVAFVLWVGWTSQNLQLQFGEDIWSHIPAINEFMADPAAPDHIYLPAKVPHHSLNAYHLILASIAGLFDISPVHTAQMAGLFNSAAILVLFPQFVRTFVREHRAPLIGLLLVGLAWGPGVWIFSGFLNLESFGLSTPYPSHFAIWLSFGVLWALRRIIESPSLNPLGVAAVCIAGFLIANAHPITYGGMLIFAVALVFERRSSRGGVVLAGSLLVAAVGVLAWPYFSLVEFVNDPDVFDAEHQSMYTNVLARVAPALLGIWPLFKRFQRYKSDALVSAFVVASSIYMLGFVTDRATLGRIVPWAVMSLQLALAGGVARWFDRQGSEKEVRAILVGGAFVLLGIALASSAVLRMVPKALLPQSLQDDPRLDNAFEYVIPIGSVIGQGDVVLAPVDLSTPMASAGADLVTFRPVPFVPDQEQRRNDVEAFFENPDPSILSKYDVDWIAFRPDDIEADTATELRRLGTAEDVLGVTMVRLP